jgi:hypothetical protein
MYPANRLFELGNSGPGAAATADTLR